MIMRKPLHDTSLSYTVCLCQTCCKQIIFWFGSFRCFCSYPPASVTGWWNTFPVILCKRFITIWAALSEPHSEDVNRLTDCLSAYIIFCVDTHVSTKGKPGDRRQWRGPRDDWAQSAGTKTAAELTPGGAESHYRQTSSQLTEGV